MEVQCPGSHGEHNPKVAGALSTGMGPLLDTCKTNNLTYVLSGKLSKSRSVKPSLNPLKLVGCHATLNSLLGQILEHPVEPVRVLWFEGQDIDLSTPNKTYLLNCDQR